MASSIGRPMDESKMKKRLQIFLGEMLKLGSVKGFKYFSTYIRGREEMIVSILNELQSTGNSYCSSEMDLYGQKCSTDWSGNSSFTSQNLPYDRRSLMLSQKTQMALSGLKEHGVGLPPASPSDEDAQEKDADSTVFLVAGYSRYSCPYVWVRSNHTRLVKLAGGESKEKDNPLSLKSTSRWKDCDVCIWDVIAELVKLCTYPAPLNPFAVDFTYISALSLHEQIMTTAAMTKLLQKILLNSESGKMYIPKVLEDFQVVNRSHFEALRELVKIEGLSDQAHERNRSIADQSRKYYTSLSPSHFGPTQTQSVPFNLQTAQY